MTVIDFTLSNAKMILLVDGETLGGGGEKVNYSTVHSSDNITILMSHQQLQKLSKWSSFTTIVKQENLFFKPFSKSTFKPRHFSLPLTKAKGQRLSYVKSKLITWGSRECSSSPLLLMIVVYSINNIFFSIFNNFPHRASNHVSSSVRSNHQTMTLSFQSNICRKIFISLETWRHTKVSSCRQKLNFLTFVSLKIRLASDSHMAVYQFKPQSDHYLQS